MRYILLFPCGSLRVLRDSLRENIIQFIHAKCAKGDTHNARKEVAVCLNDVKCKQRKLQPSHSCDCVKNKVAIETRTRSLLHHVEEIIPQTPENVQQKK